MVGNTETCYVSRGALLWPIATNVSSAMNQSQFEENRGKRKIRVNGFGSSSRWLRNWRACC